MADLAVLVDSSVWIEGLSLRAPEKLRVTLRALIEANRAVVTEMIRLEVMVGTRSDDEFAEFRADFDALRCLKTDPAHWLKAEELSILLVRRGARVPPSDLLIAAVALAHAMPVWHADKDFERVRHAVPTFRTLWYPQHHPEI